MTNQTNTSQTIRIENTQKMWHLFGQPREFGSILFKTFRSFKKHPMMTAHPLSEDDINRALKDGLYIIIPRESKDAFDGNDFPPSNKWANFSVDFLDAVPMTIGKPSRRVLANALNRFNTKDLPERLAVGFIPSDSIDRDFLQTLRTRDIDGLTYTMEPVFEAKIVRLRTRFLKQGNDMILRFLKICGGILFKLLLNTTVMGIVMLVVIRLLSELFL